MTRSILASSILLALACSSAEVREPAADVSAEPEVAEEGVDDPTPEAQATAPAPFQHASSAAADLTGDGRPDTLRLMASGPGPMEIEVTFTVESMGRELLRESWVSHEYFRYEPDLAMTGSQEAQYAHVRSYLGRFFDSSNFVLLAAGSITGDPEGRVDIDRDPVGTISSQLLVPTLRDSLAATGVDSSGVYMTAVRLAYERRHPGAEDIWSEMTGRDLMTFMMYAGGERTERLAWSQGTGQFFSIWGCC